MVNKKRVDKEKANQENDKILFAFLATFLSLLGFLIAIIVKRKDKYVMHYAKQSLVIFVFSILAGSIGSILGNLFLIGILIKIGLNILIVIIWAMSWVYALSGKRKQIPIVSYWAKKIEL